MLKIGIYGASGYTGQELLRLLVRHPEADVTAVTSRKFKDERVSGVYPALKGLTDLKFMDASPLDVASMCDLVFLALPHGEAMEVASSLLKEGKKVVDLSADFRLRDVNVYEKWYIKHTKPDFISQAVYGLPELYGEDVKKANLVANPGCYPTSIILGMAPLIKSGFVDGSSIIADSKSGVSGAGRELQIGSLFCEVNEGFKAYKIGVHRHTPEIEQELSCLAGRDVKISFTPHLVPINRGILSTIYADLLKNDITEADLFEAYKSFYNGKSFVRICDVGTFPNISSVKGSNNCDIGFKVDKRTGRVVVVSVIDNLVKGAAGQAIQNMNLMCGFPEDEGLKAVALFP